MVYLIITAVVIIATLVILGKIRYNKSKVNDGIYPLYEITYLEGSDALKMFTILNKFRADKLIKVVVADKFSTLKAIDRCNKMIADGVVSHTGFPGVASDLKNLDADFVGENVAYAYESIKGLMTGFYKSDAHRRAMLNPNFDWVGMGSVRDNITKKKFYCIVFGGDTLI